MKSIIIDGIKYAASIVAKGQVSYGWSRKHPDTGEVLKDNGIATYAHADSITPENEKEALKALNESRATKAANTAREADVAAAGLKPESKMSKVARRMADKHGLDYHEVLAEIKGSK